MNPTTDELDSAPPVSTRPAPGPGLYVLKGLKVLASLQLTVVMFAIGILLVFFGTVAQMDFGIWTVVDKYFWSWVVMVPFDLFHKFGSVFIDPNWKDEAPWEGSFPFPGGKLVGAVMLANLLAAHFVRFKISWRRTGILLIHSGLILLFVGEFITREYAVEQRMTIEEGMTVGYTENNRVCELAFVDKSDAAMDRVVVVPASLLSNSIGSRITNPELPVDLEVREYMVNSALEKATPGARNLATTGLGLTTRAVEKPEVTGVDTKQVIDTPAAYITLFEKGTNNSLGTFLVSLMLTFRDEKEGITVAGKRYDIALRFKRYYKPYTLRLEKFTFDRYPGTEKPKNYASRVILNDPDDGVVDQEHTISMNSPMRHAGETFYQQSFDEATERTTVLQVVKNPGWLIPYLSCIVVTLGLLVHFGLHLTQFLNRRAAA